MSQEELDREHGDIEALSRHRRQWLRGRGMRQTLAKHDVPVTLIDRNNYHQFQPLLYQVATGELGTPDVARPLRAIFEKSPTVGFHRAEVSEVDPATRTVTTADGRTFTGIGAVNPALTAMANAIRVGEHLAERLR
jgi:NADH dehydrogenase FAD-containing subunit